MTSGIYCITNLVNDKRYIGQSKNIEVRFKDHFSRLRRNAHPNSYLQNSFNKYGESNFSFDVLCKCCEEDLDAEEKKLIKLYDTYNQGFNLTEGGEVSPMTIPEIAKKVSNNMKGSKNPNYGKKFSKEHKEGIKEGNKGKHNINNKSGFYRVGFQKTKNRIYYVYRYTKNGKQKAIIDKGLFNLKQKVKQQRLEWKVIDEIKMNKTLEWEKQRTARALVYGDF